MKILLFILDFEDIFYSCMIFGAWSIDHLENIGSPVYANLPFSLRNLKAWGAYIFTNHRVKGRRKLIWWGHGAWRITDYGDSFSTIKSGANQGDSPPPTPPGMVVPSQSWESYWLGSTDSPHSEGEITKGHGPWSPTCIVRVGNNLITVSVCKSSTPFRAICTWKVDAAYHLDVVVFELVGGAQLGNELSSLR